MFAVLFAGLAGAADSCESQISSSLTVALTKAFPKFRAPFVSDNSPEDVESDIKEGRNGCLGVAIADFDGDGTDDTLLGLTALKGSGGLIVVALTRDKHWKLKALREWSGRRAGLYVAVGKPGMYRRTESAAGPLEPGEVDLLTCLHATAVFGAIEASSIAYCYNNQRWQHTWISD
jgi:hypothetical protein